MKELKQCPFCGGDPEIYQQGKKSIVIKCKCGIAIKQSVIRYSLEWLREKMIETWNTRHIYPKVGKVFNGKMQY